MIKLLKPQDYLVIEIKTTNISVTRYDREALL
jgi:hypothetical protein